MIKHIPYENSTCVCLDELNDKIVHIKTSPRKNGFCHVYWNKSRSKIISGSRNVKLPVISIAHLLPCKSDHRDLFRTEIQFGDSICYIFATRELPILCASVVGLLKENGKIYLYLQKNDPHSPVDEIIKAEYKAERFFLVSSNNAHYRTYAAENLVYAVYQDELERIEIVYSAIRSARLIKKYLKSDESLGESAFKACHNELFRGVFAWAGCYRKEEVVITARNYPTMDPDKIPCAISDFFLNFSARSLPKIGADKEKMLNALVSAHSELAWIHPFLDGNGRAIRLYLELIARKCGFSFNLNAAVSSKRRKRFYHYAVRRAIKKETCFLKSILKRALN